ncbi:MAG: alpha/beta hydrolase [Pseudomonadaceae bacterium]|nr:alpha/beta hydrolase [Pseudomonadaceae bacterium]
MNDTLPCLEQRPANLQNPPVLVILCGVNSGAYLFEPALQAFGSTHHLLIFNTPGVAGMPLPMPFTVEAYAKLVADMLDARGIGTFNLLGHSLGGFAAQQLAHLMPERVERLVLVSTSRGQPDTTRDLPLIKARSGLSFWEQAQAIAGDPHTRLKPYFGDAFPVQHPAAYARFIEQRQKYLPKTAVSMAHFSAGAAFSSRRWVGGLAMPALVVQGSDDVMISARAARKLAAALPHARYLELYGVGHFPMLEHECFYPVVGRYLAGHPEGVEQEHRPPGVLRRLYQQWFTLHG